MKTIVFANQKGGVGKTTLAIELYRNLVKDGLRVAFYNLDNQGGGVDTAEVENPDFVVVDTPGVLEEGFSQHCANADVVIIPCRPSVNDIKPTERSWRLARDVCQNVYLVANEYNQRNILDQDFIEYIAGTEMRLLCCIPHSTRFGQAAATQTSVTDQGKASKASEAIGKMKNRIKEICSE